VLREVIARERGCSKLILLIKKEEYKKQRFRGRMDKQIQKKTRRQ